jgi:hypothetical protein
MTIANLNTHKLTDEVDVPDNVNRGLTVASPLFLQSLLGSPRKSYTNKCQEMTNKELYSSYIVSEDVGRFKVNGLRPAVESLRKVLVSIAGEQPAIYAKLGRDGMLCCRHIGNSNKISNHSWGIAIDLLIDAKLDPYNNGKTFYGLTLIAPIFNRYGWFWGGRFRTSEDAMHFEVSKEKLIEWQRDGMFGPVSTSRQETIANASSHDRSKLDFLQKGDKGHSVVALQNALKARNYNITSDGCFGKNTELALIDFQRKHGLITNGTVGPKTALFLALF